MRKSNEKKSNEKKANEKKAALLRAQMTRVSVSKPKENTNAQEALNVEENLRSPICCVLGHVDVGKTKLLDLIRSGSIQGSEPGGITQKISTTYYSAAAIERATVEFRKKRKGMKVRVPGILFIDTPGHEAFANIRESGSAICDIAILVVDITKGIEKQTIEALRQLEEKKCPFIVALNKIDRIYGWQSHNNMTFEDTYSMQVEHVREAFDHRIREIVTEFAMQGVNVAMYTCKDMSFSPIVPISANSGEGLPDLLAYVVVLTQKTLDVNYDENNVSATVLEVENGEGVGKIVNVILINGKLNVRDNVVMCGPSGPIHVRIKALITSDNSSNKSVRAAQSVRIVGSSQDPVVGTPVLVIRGGDNVQELEYAVMRGLNETLDNRVYQEKGVCVQAATLGSLQSFTTHLMSCDIGCSYSNISTVNRRDIQRAAAMISKGVEYAVVLVFGVKVSPEARAYADETGVRIFSGDVIYSLSNEYLAYVQEIKEKEKEAVVGNAVFPCVLAIYEEHIFNTHSPIVLGCKVESGQARIGTPLVIPTQDGIIIGKITSMQQDKKDITIAEAGKDIAVKIEQSQGDQDYYYGRHFTHTDKLVSKLSRESIDLLKTYFRDEVKPAHWNLIKKLKGVLGIM